MPVPSHEERPANCFSPICGRPESAEHCDRSNMLDVILRAPGRRHRVTPARFWLRWRFHSVPALFRLGCVVKIGLIDLFPGNFLASVTGELAHDSDHRAAG